MESNSALLSFEARAEAGLDAPTRDLIRQMPSEIRKQILLSLKEAKPLIDNSLAKAIEGVQQALHTTLNTARCQAEGFREATADSISAFFWHLNPFGSDRIAGRFEQLDQEWREMRSGFDYSATARHIALATADEIHQLSIAECLVDLGQQAAPPVMANSLSAQWDRIGLLWISLANLCGTPDMCLVSRYEVVGEIIATADSRDIEEAGAKESYELIPEPHPVSFLGRFGYSIDTYEPHLLSLQDIERSVALAKLRRDERARSIVDGLGSIVVGSEANIRNAYIYHGYQTKVGNEQTAILLKAIVKQIVPVRERIKSALDTSRVVKPVVDSLAKRFARVLNRYNLLVGTKLKL
jgi:hypothetical protein